MEVPNFLFHKFKILRQEKNNEEQLKLVVGTTFDGFWDWKIREDYEYMSPRFWQILGFKENEKKHHSSEWQSLMFEEDLKKTMKNLELHVESKGQHPFRQQVRLRHKKGKTVWVIRQGRVVEWDDLGEPVRMIGTHTDITALKEMQKELEAEKEAGFRAARLAELGEMAGGIAHEINNPLAILSGHAGLLLKCAKKDNIPKSIVEKSANAITVTVERISIIVQGLRNFARDGKDDDFEEFAADEWVSEVLALCKDRCARLGIKIVISDEIKKSVLWGQRVQLSQVLINILNNAFDAINDSEEKWVQLEFKDRVKYVDIIIKDSGPGIPQEVRSKMMKPFFTTKKMGHGTGIGLSMCKNIIEKHHGRFFLDEKQNHTTFVIRLPKKDSMLYKGAA